MKFDKIILNSLKYPFRNIKKLPILFMLFILIALIPIGIISDNQYVLILGYISFFIFILIVPGYLFSMISFGLNESSMFPSLSFTQDIYNSVRVLILRMVYMIVPATAFFISMYLLGISSPDMIFNMNIKGLIFSLGFALIIVLITYILFEVLLFFAKARLAYLDSLTEALKMHKVVGDIFNIGIFNIIKWVIVMAVLMIVVSVVSSWIIAIPYVGFLIYICIVIPILESIGNYSLGLLYSNIALNSNDLTRFERKIQ